jgi:hypothetical protein
MTFGRPQGCSGGASDVRFFGKPALTGTYDGKHLRVPLTGEFAAFVLLKGPR